MKDICKIALVGYGGMARWHGNRIKSVPDEFEIVGCYDIDPVACGRFEQDFGIKAYKSLNDLCDDKRSELVIVAIPNDVHKETVIKLLSCGKNVICEKPVTLSSSDLEEMIAASHQYNRLFTVHQNRRWDEDWRIVKKLYDDNTLGPVFNIESRVHGSRGIPGDWRNTKEHGGGMIYDWGIHLFDQILMLKGAVPVKSVYAELSYVTNEAVDDGFKVLLHFADGMKAHIEVGTSNFVELPRWYVQGENGTAVITDWACNGKIVKVTDWEKRDAVPVVTAAGLTKTMAPRTDETIAEEPLPRVPSDQLDYYRNVKAAIRGTETQLITHDQLRRSMRLMEACFESGRLNRVVEVEI